MTKRPFLLLTNDDGIQAPGIKHLWEVVSDFADVAVVAPSTEQSGTGLSITWFKPLKIHPINWGTSGKVWSVSGTPADCVKMACSTLLTKKPDMVISGINRGSNAGRTTLYSGTVGGVIEGIMRGIPGIAFSFCDFTTPPTSATKEFIIPILKHFLNHPVSEGTLINVNFPKNCEKGVKGVKFAKQGRGFWIEDPEKRLHPDGIPYYWLGGKWSHFTEDPMSDVALLEEGFVTATPIHVGNLTDTETLQNQKAKFEESFLKASVP